MRALRGLLAAAGVAFTLPGIASAQTPALSARRLCAASVRLADTKYVFRLNGTPWICRGDTFCKPIKIESVADKDLAQAAIESLGFAGPRYFLSYRQANFEKGKEVALSCTEERCSKLDSIAGAPARSAAYQVKQGDRMVTRTALLRQVEAKNGRAQLLWCTETDCSELPLTRDAELYLASMGSGRNDGRAVAWLRDKSGAVLSCGQPEEGVSDQLACEKTKIVLGDFPATVAAPAPAPTPPPAPAPTTSDADRNALSAAIDRAITTGDFANADRLLADATRRYAGNAAWPPLQQKLAKARADRDAQLHQAEARRLIAEARRFAQAGDFSHAEEMLRDADKQVPGFAETVQARAEIASLRTARGQPTASVPSTLPRSTRPWRPHSSAEAERLLAEYAQRFNQDNAYRTRANRLAQMRAAGPSQAGINEARAHIAAARQAMDHNDFAEADRQLGARRSVRPGFPEIGQARADLSRRRSGAVQQPDDLRMMLGVIDTAFQRRQCN